MSDKFDVMAREWAHELADVLLSAEEERIEEIKQGRDTTHNFEQIRGLLEREVAPLLRKVDKEAKEKQRDILPHNSWASMEFEFRPLRGGSGVERMTNDGEWTPDNGEWGIAFRNQNLVYYVSIPYYINILWSWCKGHWTQDEPRHPRGNPWHYATTDDKSWGASFNKRHTHPNVVAGDKAMKLTSARFGSASGGGPEFYICDPYIKRGLLRARDTGELVKFPEEFVCIYCGNITDELATAIRNQQEQPEGEK